MACVEKNEVHEMPRIQASSTAQARSERRSRNIIAWNLHSGEVRKFSSISDCARSLSLIRSTIHLVLKQQQLHTKGWQFQLIDDLVKEKNDLRSEDEQSSTAKEVTQDAYQTDDLHPSVKRRLPARSTRGVAPSQFDPGEFHLGGLSPRENASLPHQPLPTDAQIRNPRITVRKRLKVVSHDSSFFNDSSASSKALFEPLELPTPNAKEEPWLHLESASSTQFTAPNPPARISKILPSPPAENLTCASPRLPTIKTEPEDTDELDELMNATPIDGSRADSERHSSADGTDSSGESVGRSNPAVEDALSADEDAFRRKAEMYPSPTIAPKVDTTPVLHAPSDESLGLHTELMREFEFFRLRSSSWREICSCLSPHQSGICPKIPKDECACPNTHACVCASDIVSEMFEAVDRPNICGDDCAVPESASARASDCRDQYALPLIRAMSAFNHASDVPEKWANIEFPHSEESSLPSIWQRTMWHVWRCPQPRKRLQRWQKRKVIEAEEAPIIPCKENAFTNAAVDAINEIIFQRCNFMFQNESSSYGVVPLQLPTSGFTSCKQGHHWESNLIVLGSMNPGSVDSIPVPSLLRTLKGWGEGEPSAEISITDENALVPGVYFDTVNGNWVAQRKNEGQVCSTEFSAKKFGSFNARMMAIDYLTKISSPPAGAVPIQKED